MCICICKYGNKQNKTKDSQMIMFCFFVDCWLTEREEEGEGQTEQEKEGGRMWVSQKQVSLPLTWTRKSNNLA